jgi:hypothetical protein
MLFHFSRYTGIEYHFQWLSFPLFRATYHPFCRDKFQPDVFISQFTAGADGLKLKPDGFSRGQGHAGAFLGQSTAAGGQNELLAGAIGRKQVTCGFP